MTKRTRQRHSSWPSDVATGHCRPATIRAPDTSNFYIYNFFRQNLKNTHQNDKQTKRQSSTLNQSLVELKVKNHFFKKNKNRKGDAVLRGGGRQGAKRRPGRGAERQWDQDFLQNVRPRAHQSHPHYRCVSFFFSFLVSFLILRTELDFRFFF